MEAAYGLAITVTMLMTTILLFTYLSKVRHQTAPAIPFLVFFGAIEGMFFFSSLTKFFHGGYVTVLLATAIFVVMYVWRRGTAIERTQTVYLPVDKYLDQLFDLSHDEDYPLLADNLVFLTNDSSFGKLALLHPGQAPQACQGLLLPERPGHRRAVHPRVHRQQL